MVKLGGGSVSIALRDNGRGLSLTQPPANRGLGLSSMQERATILGGTMKTDSQPGQGMNLQFEIPLPTATK